MFFCFVFVLFLFCLGGAITYEEILCVWFVVVDFCCNCCYCCVVVVVVVCLLLLVVVVLLLVVVCFFNFLFQDVLLNIGSFKIYLLEAIDDGMALNLCSKVMSQAPQHTKKSFLDAGH